MVQKLLLAVTLILSTTWLLAQDSTSQTSPSAGTSASSAGQTSVEGCLQGSNGSYTLTDKSGTTYQLQGDTAKLADHVGHEVQITGTTSAGSGMGSSGTSASADASAGSQMLTVDKVKHMSKTCKEKSAQ